MTTRRGAFSLLVLAGVLLLGARDGLAQEGEEEYISFAYNYTGSTAADNVTKAFAIQVRRMLATLFISAAVAVHAGTAAPRLRLAICASLRIPCRVAAPATACST